MTSVYARLARARAEFQKQGDFRKVRAQGLQYSYLPIESAKPVIEAVTSAEGITILPVKFDIVDDPERTFKWERQGQNYTTSWTYMTAKVTFSIACESGSIELEVFGEAQDNSDKVINKVYTMAYKNMAKIVFGFAESTTDDNDVNQKPVVKAEKPAEKATPVRGLGF